ncbi:MFS transporter [Cryobacterium aureum]|uniref:MFS transporter n=1 Tax=Cryobacterium aureum TaxID=995037 RepID=UPI000CF3AD47|nr:MFS transporter [Cryobacterium aureum]
MALDTRVKPAIGDVIDNLPLSRKYYVALAATMLAFMFDAFDTQIMALALPSVLDEWNLSPFVGGLIGSSALWGMAVGALTFGFLSDVYGRRMVMIITVLGIGVLTGLSALSTSFEMLMAFRFLSGLFMGAMIPIDLAYIAEIAPKRRRGLLMASLGLTWPIGTILAALAAGALIPTVGWRWLFVVGIIPAFIALYIRRKVPESPRWLAKKGRHAEAVIAAQRLGARISSVDDIDTSSGLDSDEKRGVLKSFKILFKPLYARRTLGASLAFFLYQGATYGWSVWVPSILITVLGYPLQTAIGAVILIYTVSIGGRLFFTLTADKLPRRLAFIMAYAVMAIAALTMSSLLGLGAESGWIFLLVMLVYQFALDTNPLQVWVAELFPTEVRGLASSFASTVGRIGAATAPIIFGALMGAGLTNWVFYLIAGMCILSILVAVFVLKTETAGRSLADVGAV